MKVEFVVVDGEEAKLLAARQAEAIRALLEWVADHKGEAERDDSS